MNRSSTILNATSRHIELLMIKKVNLTTARIVNSRRKKSADLQSSVINRVRFRWMAYCLLSRIATLITYLFFKIILTNLMSLKRGKHYLIVNPSQLWRNAGLQFCSNLPAGIRNINNRRGFKKVVHFTYFTSNSYYTVAEFMNS